MFIVHVKISDKLSRTNQPGDTTGTPEALVTTGAPRALVEMGVGEITGIVVVAPAMAGLSGGTDEGVRAKLIPAIPVSNPVAADVFGVDVKETCKNGKRASRVEKYKLRR